MASNAEILAAVCELRKQVEDSAVLLAKLATRADERHKIVEDMKTEVWGNGQQGLKADVAEIRRDMRGMRKMAFSLLALVGAAVLRVIVPPIVSALAHLL